MEHHFLVDIFDLNKKKKKRLIYLLLVYQFDMIVIGYHNVTPKAKHGFSWVLLVDN